MKAAREGLECFIQAEYGSNPPPLDQVMADLIRDLMHVAKEEGINFAEALERALEAFEEESGNGG